MGLGQALLLPDNQPARESTSKHASPINDYQRQPHVIESLDPRQTSQTQQPTLREVQGSALQRMTALTNEKKAQMRGDPTHKMSEQQRQQASARGKDHSLQESQGLGAGG